MADPPHPFGLLPAGQPLRTTPTSQPTATSFLYAIPQSTPASPDRRPFAHLAVFLLPEVTLPPQTAAAIYIAQNPAALLAGDTSDPDFKFLGGVGPGKESAVFRVSPQAPTAPTAGGGVVVIGINVEDAAGVAERITTQEQSNTGSTNYSASAAGGKQRQQLSSTQALAQRIIQNAFNFLASFSGQVQGGVEVVPLKAFQEWWRKFENKIKNDPSFLEREQD